MDLSPLRKWEILGPDAEALVQWAITRDARKLSVGQVVYTAVCNETGGMIDDATVFRLGDDNFRFVGGDEYDGVWLKEQAAARGLERVDVKRSTDQLHNLAVQGPESRDLLAKIVWTPPTQTAVRRPQVVPLHDRADRRSYDGIPIVVSRTGYTGELGYEVWCHPSDGPGRLGRDLRGRGGARPEAARAGGARHPPDRVRPHLRRLRVRRPGRSVRGRDRVHGRARRRGLLGPGRAGRARRAPAARSSSGSSSRATRPPATATSCASVVSGSASSRSGTRSPILKKNIALARVAVQYAEPGTALEVGKLDGLQKRIPATVVRFPFYDPDKTRPRSSVAGRPPRGRSESVARAAIRRRVPS